MRKLGKENRRSFIILTIIVVVIISLFAYFIKIAISFDNNTYEIASGTLVYNQDYLQIVPDNKATLKKKIDGNYHLTVNDKAKTKYTIGPFAITTNNDDYAIHLYGTAYKVNTSGEVLKVTKETKIAKSSPAKFYKLADRKYLFVDTKIYTADKSINTKDYLIVELDKQGNATLANSEINVKTIGSIVLKGTLFDFDVANEKLIYEKNEIDLKNIIGSSNQYKKTDDTIDENKENDKKTDSSDENTNITKNNITNYYDTYFKNVVGSFNNLSNSVSSINDNSKNTIKKGEIYFDFSRWISLKKVTASVTSIKLDYTVFDPNSEYQAVFILVKGINGDYQEKIYLNKNDTSYILRSLKPNNEYIISFGYRLVGGPEDVYEDTVTVKTSTPKYGLNITRVTKDKIYYTLKIDSNYALESAEVVLYSDNSKKATQTVDVKQAISSSGFTGVLSYDSLGYFVEVKLENMVYNGSTIELDVSNKFINE